jgi:hypothetical protein
MPTGVLAPSYRALPHNLKLYDGPSMLNGERIFVIATAVNANRKIGRMLQLWIIPAISPIDAVRSGQDAAVCGDCRHRGDGHGHRRTCYVEWWRSVANIWQGHIHAEKVGPEQAGRLIAGLQLRIGAYGDPAAVPMAVWRPMLEQAGGWTAYTHQWRRLFNVREAWMPWCMASVDSLEEEHLAHEAGWRTFRVRPVDGVVTSREVICPHETKGVQCDSCALCQGRQVGAKSIVVTVHGKAGVKWFNSRAEALAGGV